MSNRDSKRCLSQFFTPPVVVKFMYDLVDFNPLWKTIDPACGEGVFLLEALRRGAMAVVGIDKDPQVLEKAAANLADYKGRFQLFCQDGLAEIQTDNGLWKGHYDLVIGNPPFASSKYRVRDLTILQNFTLAQREDISQALTLPGFSGDLRPLKPRNSQVIEVLFLERFIQLARPGGKIAIILPEGVLSSSHLQYVRQWLVDNFTIQAIIGLPRDTFKNMGTTAKTAIIYLEKSRPSAGHRTIIVDISALGLDGDENPQLKTVLSTVRRDWQAVLPHRKVSVWARQKAAAMSALSRR